ncbi:hypothetical protein BWI93_26160 [Siphonobacter sp. BAB-5385]|uniref:hypothetical protein n=1 Tax=Siphonobacter sp. BAB-5385 TaxID=1864822 RepID=UPI000B9E276D|nr:hypothetical protein [Siphonobacter sp. BAB-5385]OZI05301.1 hypothetical protein BWI93_26160 [Siphonobacter sp. BAB-5385]
MNTYEENCLFEIELSIHEIESSLGTGFVFQAEDTNVLLQETLEREIRLIGRALGRLVEINSVITFTATQSILQFCHSQEESWDRIWTLLKNHLPSLKKEVQQWLHHE